MRCLFCGFVFVAGCLLCVLCDKVLVCCAVDFDVELGYGVCWLVGGLVCVMLLLG